MFDDQQSVVDRLLDEDIQFHRLYNKHHQLKDQVNEANDRCSGVDDRELEAMKKQKLLLKDKLAAMIAEYQRQH